MRAKSVFQISILMLGLTCMHVFSESFYEFSFGGSKLALDIDQKRSVQREDNSTAATFSLGAYRHASTKSALGAVIEYTLPVRREEILPGSGRLVGFRVLNYLRYIGDEASVEAYAGAAQYQWHKTANGYLLGVSYKHGLLGQNIGLIADFKYYQDLAYDFDGGNDIIVDGFNSSLKLFYRF
ncbi:MAG: hypothetical protein K6L80_15890 [Agarilytica sp.]